MPVKNKLAGGSVKDLHRRQTLRDFKDSHWSDKFKFECIEKGAFVEFSEEIVDDSYDALNKFYRKEIKKERIPKKRNQAWQ